MLFTKAIRKKLLENGEKDFSGNHVPVVKIFNPYGAATWLLIAIDPESPDVAWCMADLGMDCIEAGTVLISELENIRVGPGKMWKLERDQFFKTDKRLYDFYEKKSLVGV